MRLDILNATPENPAEIPESHYRFMAENYPQIKPKVLKWIAEKSMVIVPDSCYSGGHTNGF